MMILEKSKGIPLDDITNEIMELWEKSDKNIIITIDLAKKTRSTGENSQNHHLNGHIQQICEETGNDFQEVKSYIKMQALKRGYPVKRDENEIPLLSFLGNPIPESESVSSTVECGYLIDEAHILASELGIILKE